METIRKIGIITKGIIYSLVGILTFLAAIKYGGQVSGKNKVINFLEQQTFGKTLVLIIASGLLLYALWRFYSAFLDGKNEGSDKKGIVKRIGYFISGGIYTLLSISIFTKSLGSSNSGKTDAAQMLIDNQAGIILLYIIGVILFFVGVYQFYKGYTLKFLKDIENSGSIESKTILKKSGKYGHIARGISFLIFGFFVIVAAYEKNAGAIKGLEGMFNYLQTYQWGNILMGLMAIGFLAYGTYQYFLARYSSLYS
ncbi:DUF1206 domain-containing protein [Polaribacter sp. MED152]|uniref:DUF1206 domain-containing protein n=1 Tax=Polaribacter sp. MED152 TaxID=313598 RepID=UPI000068C760|nr:DUF1206 domain-containing protein [Polaribacter sp. MED152]EAQ41713.1 hypothetical protein MED152_03325 [Polaribacter sp. MED152]